MKLRLFGREAEIRTEAVIIGISALVLLGMLIGYIFFRDTGDIIIEAGGDRLGQDETGGAAQLTGNGATAQSPGNGGSNHSEGGGADLTDGGGTEHKGNAGRNGAAKGKIAVSDGTVDIQKTGKTNEGSMAGNSSSVINAGNSPSGNTTTDCNTQGNPSNSKEGMIKIYCVGCVNKPGIVALKKGGMICDAVKEAGGLTEEADAENINMVYSLNENVMLYIKSKKNESSGLGKGAAIIYDSGPGAEVIGKGDDKAAGADGVALVNINTAGADELDTLPGIGEATARDIITYRDKSGGFESIEDIMKVPRIKENRFEGIRDYITVE